MCAVSPCALPHLLAAPGGYCGGYDDAADFDLDLDAVLRGIRSIHIPAAGLSPVPDESAVATPTTPLASLPAPLSYGGDDAAGDVSAAATQSSNPRPKKQQQKQDPGEPYDADIDATLRAMENDEAEWPSAFYPWTVQADRMTTGDRAHLVSWMYSFSRYYALAPGALHRAVSYVDRFLSTTPVTGAAGDLTQILLLLGAVSLFAAAKYEDSRATDALTADAVAWHVGGGCCTRRAVVDAERALFAALGFRLGGPTAHDFVEHFTRHGGGSTTTVRLVAHHLADVALLDYRSIRFLPSAVAASAIALAKLAVNPAAASWIGFEMEVATGYALEDLAECMAEIEEMRELEDGEWPFCAQMTEDFVRSYGFLPR
ncbi:unnamed protein product [Urochloa humidicola]